MTNGTSRRFFLGAATAAAASRIWGANDRVNVAIVGLGGRGSSHLKIYSNLPEARVVGLCDINQAARERPVRRKRKPSLSLAIVYRKASPSLRAKPGRCC